jgi:methyltransferase
VRRGPYRFLRHPNYVVVIGEIALLPLAFGAWQIALVFSILNLALLWHRIRVENTALAARR